MADHDLKSAITNIDTPILIVGGGPVGMMLAMNLNALRVSCVIVNSDSGPRWHPKGSTHNSRTMEHYRRLGIAAEIRKLALPQEYPTDVAFFTRFSEWEIARLKMPSEAEKARAAREALATDQVPEPIFRGNQMYVERFLFQHLCELPGVDVRFGWRCMEWTDDGDRVNAMIEDVSTGDRIDVTCQYFVGCDGGQSAIRRKLGIHYTGEGPRAQSPYLDGPMVASHLRVPDFYSRIRQPRCWQYRAVNPELYTNTVALDGVSEFIFNTKLAAPDEKPDERRIVQTFLASAGADLSVEAVDHSTWTAGRALVAEKFGAGHVVLCGDSLHLFTPTGGFGMNTGIDDAANLGWKLAALVQGWGGPNLLASFEEERRPIAFRNTLAAKRLSVSVVDIPIGERIEEDTEAGALARRRAAEFLGDFSPEFSSLGIQLGARYDTSPLIIADGSAPPDDNPYDYVPSACPGGRLPHLWLRDRVSLFDHLGPGFTLLSLDERKDVTEVFARVAVRRGVPLRIVFINEPEARDLYQRRLVLVRPDQHVAWRGDVPPPELDTLFARILGSSASAAR